MQVGIVWNQVIVVGVEQVGQVVQVVGVIGNGWVQVIIGYILFVYVVELLQQCVVEGFYCCWISEVDVLFVVWIEDDEVFQFWVVGDQVWKVVVFQVVIVWVQWVGVFVFGVGMWVGWVGYVFGFCDGEVGIIYICWRLVSVFVEWCVFGLVIMEIVMELLVCR